MNKDKQFLLDATLAAYDKANQEYTSIVITAASTDAWWKSQAEYHGYTSPAGTGRTVEYDADNHKKVVAGYEVRVKEAKQKVEAALSALKYVISLLNS
jgi:hypothetical protein